MCDGAVYNSSDYPELSEFIKAQFSNLNYFGGNGTTTFAVPDMRNLFLRGYHGSAQALSGEIGAKQEGTEHTYVQSTDGNDIVLFGKEGVPTRPKNTDTVSQIANSSYRAGWEHGSDGETNPEYYTARPVNMAVLYCIKAVS